MALLFRDNLSELSTAIGLESGVTTKTCSLSIKFEKKIMVNPWTSICASGNPISHVEGVGRSGYLIF